MTESSEQEATTCIVNGRSACIVECPNYSISRRLWLNLTGSQHPAHASEIAPRLNAANSVDGLEQTRNYDQLPAVKHRILTHEITSSSSAYAEYLNKVRTTLGDMRLDLPTVWDNCILVQEERNRS